MDFSPVQLLIVLVIVLLVFGAKKLPEIGRNLGAGAREFKDGITGKGKGDDDDDAKPELTEAEQAFGEKPAPTTSVAAEDPERT